MTADQIKRASIQALSVEIEIEFVSMFGTTMHEMMYKQYSAKALENAWCSLACCVLVIGLQIH
jgi:hypothetical protein